MSVGKDSRARHTHSEGSCGTDGAGHAQCPALFRWLHCREQNVRWRWCGRVSRWRPRSLHPRNSASQIALAVSETPAASGPSSRASEQKNRLPKPLCGLWRREEKGQRQQGSSRPPRHRPCRKNGAVILQRFKRCQGEDMRSQTLIEWALAARSGAMISGHGWAPGASRGLCFSRRRPWAGGM
jgi:hypothetical protein